MNLIISYLLDPILSDCTGSSQQSSDSSSFDSILFFAILCYSYDVGISSAAHQTNERISFSPFSSNSLLLLLLLLSLLIRAVGSAESENTNRFGLQLQLQYNCCSPALIRSDWISFTHFTVSKKKHAEAFYVT